MSEKDVVDLIEKASESVVNVNTIRIFRDVFYRVVPVQGMGSGFIIDNEGYVLTNNHVIAEAREITVTLSDSRVFQGQLAGTSRRADVAVIKIEGENLTPATLGDSDKLRVGQRVYAIGNPFGLVGGPTVTSGVISALNRTIHSEQGAFEAWSKLMRRLIRGTVGDRLLMLREKWSRSTRLSSRLLRA